MKSSVQKRSTRLGVLGLVGAAALTLMAPAGAFATSNDGDGANSSPKTPSSTFVIPRDGANTDPTKPIPYATVWTPNNSGNGVLQGASTGNNITNRFYSNVSWWGGGTSARIDRGSASSYISGPLPVALTQSNSTQKWWAGGVGVSASVPGGVGFSASGSEARFSVDNNGGPVNVIYGGIEFGGLIFTINQSMSSSYSGSGQAYQWETN